LKSLLAVQLRGRGRKLKIVHRKKRTLGLRRREEKRKSIVVQAGLEMRGGETTTGGGKKKKAPTPAGEKD